jgi:DNA-binding CsgD family transcriptional regulator
LRDEDAELIDLIYAATLGERPWEDFVARLGQTSPGGCAVLFSLDLRRTDTVVTILEGRPAETKAGLDTHYGSVNPYKPYCMSKPLGVGIPGDRMLSRDRLVRSEFFNDFLLKHDLTATLGVAVDRSEDFIILISTATRLNDEAEQIALSEQYTRLAPHLKRAAAFYRRNAPGRMATELGASLYDDAEVGTMLVTPGLKIVSMSPAADRILAPHLAFDAAGAVRLPGDEAQAALKAMSSRRYDGPQSRCFAVGDLRLTLVKISRGGVIGLFDDCGVAVLVRSAGGAPMSPERAREVYGLTAAEMRVLPGILAGQTAEEIARSLARSRETIRSQMKSVYAKTNSSGKMDLIRLMNGLGSAGRG